MPAAAPTAAARRNVPLPQRLIWSIPDLAEMCGIRNAKLLAPEPDDSGRHGTVRLPGGRTVAAHRDVCTNRWQVYRYEVEQAIAAGNDEVQA